MGKEKGGMTAEQVNALKFGLELNARDIEATNKIMDDFTENLLEENKILREENYIMKAELMDLHKALDIFRYYSGDQERCV